MIGVTGQVTPSSGTTPTPFPRNWSACLPHGKGHSVFVSKYGKTYDEADGSEQRDVSAPKERPGAQRGGEIGRERWDDDGGPANDREPAPLAPRPAWSVLSLGDLNDAIRKADDASRQRVARAPTERAATGIRVAAERSVAAAQALADRYRNAWENT